MMRQKLVTSSCGMIQKKIVFHLEKMKDEEKLEAIDKLMRLLEFERRLAELTPEEKEHMNNRSLSPAAKAAVDKTKSVYERNQLIAGYARAIYHRRCAWSNYLHGVSKEKPFESKSETAAA